MKNILIALLFMVMTALCCGGCESDDTFSKKSLARYEALIGVSDAEVIKSLGVGEIRQYELTVNGKTHLFLHDRFYPGSLLDPDGLTEVRYYSFGKEHVISGAYKNDPRKVACVLMFATLPITEGSEIQASLTQMFDAPSWEEMPFDEKQDYFGSWDKEDFYYVFRFDPKVENKEGKCNIVFAICDKEFFRDDSDAINADGDSQE